LHDNLRGIEKKPLPYLLCMMNLMLHGIESPIVIRGNALVQMRDDIRPKERVDVVLTNPPFGGEEEASVAKRYPSGLQTKETAWLYLQGIIDRLKPSGRCAIVLPNSVLGIGGGGVGTRIKQKLLRECNLHTIVRLPQGVFAPYTPIPSNLLFFEKGGATKEVWFYQMQLPPGWRGYSKTKPMPYEAFADCRSWWGGRTRTNRIKNENAWRVSIADIRESGYNLDFFNPNVGDDLARHPPQEVLKELVATENEINRILLGLAGNAKAADSETFPLPWDAIISRLIADSTLREFLIPVEDLIDVVPDGRYRIAGIYSYGRGLFARAPVEGSETSYRRYNILHKDQFVYSRLFGWEGALAVVPEEFEGFCVSNEFPTFTIDTSKADPRYVAYLAQWNHLHEQLKGKTTGMGSRRQRVGIEKLLSAKVPLPDLDTQSEIVSRLDKITRVQILIAQEQALIHSLQQSVMNSAIST
jgi:hypothetical protein